ncbi:hypothetical protein IE81DRAFT_305379 [Ceraceosorus guamensis]|uniref:25S rRNA adenine-N(1) methyltransferase n=1 Tax=Ceraceosorus guamensis TaxID=1522189 RepID=A0A316VXM8_9BASI|nr:hypothetical protein IE81DRAFT_305379 [Ceraceosorus guamensis]PWN40255.1 hypothetical protein IE81DRAFT_305379 [Ceraceosorus guamensis]
MSIGHRVVRGIITRVTLYSTPNKLADLISPRRRGEARARARAKMSQDMVVKDGNVNVQIGASSSANANADADAAGAAIRPRTRGKRGGAKNKKPAVVEDVVAAATAPAPHQDTSGVAGTSSTSAPLSTEVARAAPVGQATTESAGAAAKSGKPKAAVTRDEDGKLIRPRGKRGGSKNNNRKVVSSSSGSGSGKDSNRSSAISSAFKKSIKSKSTASSSSSSSLEQTSALPSAGASAHSLAIAQWHALEKELSQPNTSPARKQEILKKQKELGGLRAYQDASVVGANHLKAGETGKWCAEMLQEVRGKEPLHLLDVGAIAGTAYLKYPWINSTSIDLEPRSEAVIRSDFFDFAKPDLDRQQAEDVWSKAVMEGGDEGGEEGRAKRWRGKFDVVALSLVVNYVGDLEQRGRMLLHAHHYLTPTGYLYLVLPNACVCNSRYMTHDRLTCILDSAGYRVVRQDDSKRLSRWLCARKDAAAAAKAGNKKHAGWDGKKWGKEEVMGGAVRNNFCIKLVGP